MRSADLCLTRLRIAVAALMLAVLLSLMTACTNRSAEASSIIEESTSVAAQPNASSDVSENCNPITFGADPTGTSDSSPAIAACVEANKGGRVVFSPGTYLVSEPIRTPHLATDRISIDFNGATISPIKEMECVLDVGGFGEEKTSEAGVIRTYYMNWLSLFDTN